MIGVTTVLTFFLSKPIGAYQLGEAYAQSMGVNIRFFRVALILLSSILSASVTAFAGPISFVGIAVPYLVKHALRTSKPLVVIPGTFVGGAVFCMICDLIARMAFATNGIEYQYGDFDIRSACCDLHDGAWAERQVEDDRVLYKNERSRSGISGECADKRY